MTNLAYGMLRRRPGSVIATLLALAVGVMILTTMGVLIESGLRYRPEPQRYAGTAIVVADRDITFTGKEIGGDPYKTTVNLPDGGTVPADLVEKIQQIPGVAAAVPDHSIPILSQAFGSAVGHGWSSAALTPYRLIAGSEPRRAGDIVVSSDAHLRVGQSTDLTIAGTAHRFRIAGIADQSPRTSTAYATAGDQPAALFFTDAQATALAPHPGRVDAIGVMTTPDADQSAVAATVGQLAESVAAKAYTGDDRAKAEQSGIAAQAKDLLIQIGAAFGGYIVLLIICVVAGTVGLSVRHRRRDLALLRAIGATPGQVRRMLMAEAALTGLAAAIAGVPLGLLTTHWAVGELVSRGFVPAEFPMVNGALAALAAVAVTTLFAVLASLIAARRITAIRPTEALGEAAVEPARSGKVRLGFGLVTLLGGVSSSVASIGLGGQSALAAAVGMLYLFVIAVGLLAPWINRFAAKLLAPVLNRVWGTSGFLATANLKANAQGMATVLTALVLAVGFGGSVWFLQDNLQRATVEQSRDGMRAQHALVAPGGLPAKAVDELRATPGVEAVTGVRRTSVLVRIMDGAEVVPARAIDPVGADATMDLKVEQGSLSELRGDTVAVSALRASSQGWKLGEQVEIWLGDGTAKKLRVVAIYERGLGFGDVVLSREAVGGGLDEVLIRTSPGFDAGALAEVAAHYPTSSFVGTGELNGKLADDLALSAWLNKLLIGVMVGYAALAAANTMVMAAVARRRELALLRLAGVTRRQVKRMVHAEQAGLLGVALAIGGTIAALTLVAVVATLTGDPIPFVPPLGWVAVLGGATLLAMATTVLPISRLLRTPPVDHVGAKE
ncbi:FtsX-like permease family protein [Kribbella sp. NPDC056861]|uniref:FtsX-like permease family protein n=1 Tax=Kribbella sp. NPDC056861 TaxID=3154857 RepID=UPI003424ADE2